MNNFLLVFFAMLFCALVVDAHAQTDTVPPLLLQPADIVVSTNNSNGIVVTFEPVAIEVEKNNSIVPVDCVPESGTLFPLGITIVTCTATDDSGNTSPESSFSVTVNLIVDAPSAPANPVESVPKNDPDADGDGIDDDFDSCMYEPETINGYLDTDGCPDEIPEETVTDEIPENTSEIIESEIRIPDWIRTNAAWWADDQIDDKTFASGIQFLINDGILIVPITESGVAKENVAIPNWIKNNAAWWADDQIDDKTFASGIQFLIKEGIITV